MIMDDVCIHNLNNNSMLMSMYILYSIAIYVVFAISTSKEQSIFYFIALFMYFYFYPIYWWFSAEIWGQTYWSWFDLIIDFILYDLIIDFIWYLIFDNWFDLIQP